jgi:hypothetical protein
MSKKTSQSTVPLMTKMLTVLYVFTLLLFLFLHAECAEMHAVIVTQVCIFFIIFFAITYFYNRLFIS